MLKPLTLLTGIPYIPFLYAETTYGLNSNPIKCSPLTLYPLPTDPEVDGHGLLYLEMMREQHISINLRDLNSVLPEQLSTMMEKVWI